MAISCTPTPSALLAAAKCISCLTPGQRRAAAAAMLCQLANTGLMSVPAGVITSVHTVQTQLNQVVFGAPPAGVTNTQIWTSQDNVTFSLASTVAAPTNQGNVTPASAANILYVKVRYCNSSGVCGAFSPTLRCPGAVADWWARISVNGGNGSNVSNATLAATDNFYLSLVDNGLLSQMIAVNVIAPDGLIAAITPLIKGPGNDPWTNNGGNFVLADLTVNGLAGNNSTKILLTGLIPTSIWANTGNNINAGTSGGITLYSSTLGVNAFVDAGSQSDAASGEIAIGPVFQPGGANLTFFDFCNNTTARVSAVNAGWIGFTSGNRTSGTAEALYIASSTHAFSTLNSNANNAVGNAMPTRELCVFGYRNNAAGTLVPNTDRRLSFAAFHTGLSAGDAQNLFNAVQALRVALGGGFV